MLAYIWHVPHIYLTLFEYLISVLNCNDSVQATPKLLRSVEFSQRTMTMSMRWNASYCQTKESNNSNNSSYSSYAHMHTQYSEYA